MKKKISITIDSEIINTVERIAKKKHTNRSQIIEDSLRKEFAQVPAIILAEGITNKKSGLITFEGKKVIDIQLQYLLDQNFTKIFLSTDCDTLRKYVIRNYPVVEILYQNDTLGSGGALKRHKDMFNTRVIFMYYNVISDINLNKLVEFHIERNSNMTLVVTSVDEPSKYGNVQVDATEITDFKEKPAEPKTHLAFTGIGIIEKIALNMLSDVGKLELQVKKIDNKHAYVYEGLWESIDVSKKGN